MNKNYTLKELADIGAKAAEDECSTMAVSRGHEDFGIDAQAREAFTKAVLDAIGYEFPKDEEWEAFERWCESRQPLVNHVLAKEDQFAAWKAGREELRKAINKPSYSTPPYYAGITLLGANPNEPAWIPWNGGQCPLPDTVKRWEYRNRDGFESINSAPPKSYRWIHTGYCDDIIAYRVWE